MTGDAANPNGSADDSPGGIDFPAVAKVSTRVAPKSVSFFTASANRFVAADEIPAGWQDTAFIGLRAHVLRMPADTGELAVAASFLALAKNDVDLATEGLSELGEDESPDLVIEAELELIYTLRDGPELSEHDVEQFAHANGTLHAWPYWREFAQSSSQRLGVPPLLVGVFKLPSRHDPENEND